MLGRLGMGDMGVATSTDAFFSNNGTLLNLLLQSVKWVLGLVILPYLESIITDISLLNASFYNKLDETECFCIGVLDILL